MLRDLVDRFAYRYQLWTRETQGDNVGAGEPVPELSPRGESSWRMILRFAQMIVGGLFLISVLYRFAMHMLPSLGDGIPMFAILLAVTWCGVVLFMAGGELLTNYSRGGGDDDKSI
jgi:hypothetical protein